MSLAIVPLVLFFSCFFIISLYKKGRDATWQSLAGGYRMMRGLLPIMLLAFLVSGFLEVTVSPHLIQNWLGEKAGVKGYLVSMAAGALIPGGPYNAFPIIGAVYRAGAAIGPAVTMLTSWGILGISLIIYEIAFLGLRFTAVRLVLMFWAPLAAGLVAQYLFG
ncbi:MAG: permease [Desulfobacterales bacterium]|nr:permease [Desulfobacterales bacterium]